MLPWMSRYLLGDYFGYGLHPMREYPPGAPLRPFGVNESDGFRTTSTNGMTSYGYEDEMQKMMEETRKRNEQRREEEEKRHQQRMRSLMMTDCEEESKEEEQVLVVKKRELEERKKEEDARAKLELENRLKKGKELQEKEKMKEERKKIEFEQWKEAEKKRWDSRNSDTEKTREEKREAEKEKLEKIEAENAARLAKSEEESVRMKEEFKDQLRQEKEQNERAYGAYCNSLRSQLGHIMKMMETANWNRKIEKKWSYRLNELKKWFTPVRQSFNILRLEFGRKNFSATDRSNIESTMNVLLERLEMMKKVMENEVGEMERMSEEHPEATFMADIEESARAVALTSSNLIKNLQILVEELHKKRCEMEKWNRCVQSFESLEKKVDLIPTVNGLKEKQLNQKQSEMDESIDEPPPVSSLIITELD